MQVIVTIERRLEDGRLRSGSIEKMVMYVEVVERLDVLRVGHLLDRDELDVADRPQRRGHHGGRPGAPKVSKAIVQQPGVLARER